MENMEPSGDFQGRAAASGELIGARPVVSVFNQQHLVTQGCTHVCVCRRR